MGEGRRGTSRGEGLLWVLAVYLLLTLASSPPAHADSPAYTAVVHPAARAQTLEGWGTSLCWWANVVGGFPAAVRADYLARIFDPVQGLGLTVARYNIGGGENPALPHSMQFRCRIPGFEPSDGVWDWQADADQRRVLLESRRLGVTLTEAFANSPPYWMTVSGTVTGAADGGSNLNPADYDKFADYLAEVTRHYHDAWGVTFRTLEPMNESTTTYWKKGGRQEGYHIDPRNAQDADQNTLVKKTAAALTRRGLRTQISANDDTNIDITLNAVASYDAAAKAALAQINTHTYGGTRRAALYALAHSLGKRLWMSEHGDGDATGLTMSRDILDDMKTLHATAWVYWQAVDGRGWGLLQNELFTPDSYAYSLNEKYFVLGQYSKFIRPGDQFMDIGDPNSLAAYRASTKTLTLVTLNSTDDDTAVTYDLSQFRHVGPRVTVCRTSATESLSRLPALSLTAGRFNAPAKAKSVTTYVIAGCF